MARCVVTGCTRPVRKTGLCNPHYNRAWRQRNPERGKANYRLRRYGISQAEYDRMLAEQEAVCAVCKQEDLTGRDLAVDHDHDTGHVRGLLCGNCNRAVGLLYDNTESVTALLAYLNKKEAIRGQV